MPFPSTASPANAATFLSVAGEEVRNVTQNATFKAIFKQYYANDYDVGHNFRIDTKVLWYPTDTTNAPQRSEWVNVRNEDYMVTDIMPDEDGWTHAMLSLT